MDEIIKNFVPCVTVFIEVILLKINDKNFLFKTQKVKKILKKFFLMAENTNLRGRLFFDFRNHG